MVVYVADNITTGERILTHNRQSFSDFIMEKDRHDAVIITEFDTQEYEALQRIVELADQGDSLAIEVVKYIDQINSLKGE